MSWNLKELFLRLRTDLPGRLLLNAGYIFGFNVLPGLAGFIFWWLAGRAYPAAQIGYVSVIISVIVLLANISTLGMGLSIIRLLPDSKNPAQLINLMLTCTGAAGLLFTLFYLTGIRVWGTDVVTFLENPLRLLVFVLFVPFATWGSLIQSVFVAYRQAQYGLQFSLTYQVLRVLFSLGSVALGLSAFALIASNFFAFTVTLLVAFFYFLRRLQPDYRPWPYWNFTQILDLVPYAFGNHLSFFTTQIPQLTFPFFLLEMLGADQAGHAYIPLMIGVTLYSPVTALANSAFAEGSNAPQRARQILKNVALFSCGLMVVAGVLVAISSPILLSFFGAGYEFHGTILLQLFALAAPFYALNQSYFYYLKVTMQSSLLTGLTSFLAALTLFLTWVLIPAAGIEACGLGLFAANLALNLIVAFRIWGVEAGHAHA